jgi:pantoate--beta-alanine ligase
LLLFTHIAPLKAYIAAQKLKGYTIGLVPTMGALHKGHVSLIHQSNEQSDLTVCSIFVNPTQFNNKEDLQKYPRTIEQDIVKLTESGCDVLFHPDAAEMYPDGQEIKHYDWGAVTNSLEGAFRPGHFDGVITIVKRLLDIVEPDFAFFGQKDFQQSAVVKKMAEVFEMPVGIFVGHTLREHDGLAMSSRNVRLSPEEREQALYISRALFNIKQHAAHGRVDALMEEAKLILSQGPLLSLEYLSIVHARTLEPAREGMNLAECVALIAAWCGNVRLIDNMELGD